MLVMLSPLKCWSLLSRTERWHSRDSVTPGTVGFACPCQMLSALHLFTVSLTEITAQEGAVMDFLPFSCCPDPFPGSASHSAVALKAAVCL